MNKTLTALLNNPDDLQRSLQTVLHHLPKATSMALVIANAHILALITWMLVSDQGPAIVAPLPITQAMPQAENQQAFRQLTNAHLFGIMGTTKSAATTRVPETRLNLVLKGILADEPMKNASVIISRSKGGKEEVYGLGDKMPGGIIIKEIHSEHIILQRQGQLETLRLIKESGINTLPSMGSRTSARTPVNETLKNIRKNIVSNPASFLDYAMPIVVRDNGRQIGYRLQPKKNNGLLGQLGIQSSDVITSINGVKLDTPKNSMGALRKLSTANEINMMVRRNGTEVPLNIKLQ
jgi:general secretion pathway protein C